MAQAQRAAHEATEKHGQLERRLQRIERELDEASTMAARLRERWDAGEWGEHDDCCATRKVATMRRALDGVDAWVSGIRRVDSDTRANAPRFGWDVRFDRWKLNPLADWTERDVWNYIREHHLPYNPLHDRGYPSIGCTHCTRPPGTDGHPRAGRWADAHKTECGLHG